MGCAGGKEREPEKVDYVSTCKLLRHSRHIKVYGCTFMFICHFCKGEQLLCLPVCFSGQCSPFKIESTLKVKNLLLRSKFFF